MPKHLNLRPLRWFPSNSLLAESERLSMNGDCKDDSPVNSHESKRSGLRESFFIIFWSQVTNSQRMFWVRKYNMLLFHPNTAGQRSKTYPPMLTQPVLSKQASWWCAVTFLWETCFIKAKNVLILTTILLELNSAR